MRPSAAWIAPRHRQRLTLARAAAATTWARHIAEQQQLPLATVLAWPPPVLEAEIARAIVALARVQAQHLMAPRGEDDDGPEPQPPQGHDLLSAATRTIYARLKAVQDAQDEADQEAAWESMKRV